MAVKETCPCAGGRLVLEVSDARLFVHSARGQAHPLVAGILKLKERGGEWRWLDDAGRCDVEGCDGATKAAVYVGDGRTSEMRCKEHAA